MIRKMKTRHYLFIPSLFFSLFQDEHVIKQNFKITATTDVEVENPQ